MAEKKDFAKEIRENQNMSLKDKLELVYHLSLPGILAQISEIIMEYIDAAMVGVLGANASASIGLVSSSTWLFGGVIMACAAGFSVQVAHAVGAGDTDLAKSIFKQSLFSSFVLSLFVGMIGIGLSQVLPQWLGADVSLWNDASNYFLFFAIFIPVRQMNSLCMNMLQCAGNMKVPSIVATIMCCADVVFNYFLIFPTRQITLFGNSFTMIGAGLGVTGAQLGTSLAILLSMCILLYYAIVKEKTISILGIKGKWIVRKDILKEAVRIGVPMAMEQCATTGAQVVSTRIVAPLGTVAIAANSFAVTAESICYMPGYGISSAATTMVGQAIGAKRKDLAKSFAWLTTATGMVIMTITGSLMYFLCPFVFSFLTPVEEVQQLGESVLRIELLAEPLFAASIVANGALRGAGDTFVPGIINLVSIWCVRITLAYFLSKSIGLAGVWIAMAVELSCRGLLFLFRLKKERWLASLS
jgi:putative MATE family efflux protein